MAKIDDLIAQITDERLRKAISAEVRVLKKKKKFGLVFEGHLPETVRLPSLPVVEGELVAKKLEHGNELWRVKKIARGKATLERVLDGLDTPARELVPASVSELVVVRNFGDPIYPALIAVDRVSRGGPEKPWHALINADNFHALQLLLYSHESQVDVIYIDPPYNTGARDWKYNNDYVDSNDPWRHSKWLSFMERRLKLAKRLLKPDGVLIVTIDEHEVAHLGCLLSQVFPGCRRQMVTIVNNGAGVSQGGFYRVEEYAYFCFFGNARPNPIADDLLSDESKNDDTPLWFSLIRYGGINALPSKRPGLVYPIAIDKRSHRIIGIGKTLKERVDAGEVSGDLDAWRPSASEKVNGNSVIWPFRGSGAVSTWQLYPETLMTLAKDGFVRIRPQVNGPGGNNWSITYVKSGNRKKVLSGEIPNLGREANDGALILGKPVRSVIPKTVWRRARHDAGKWGSRTIRELLGNVSFDYAKSPYAVYDTLSSVVGNNPDALILDFFAGSGTTLHAVALLNATDGGRRRCILVTNNEVEEGKARQLRQKSIFPGEPKFESEGISDAVAWPRCKLMLQGTNEHGEELEGEYLVSNTEGEQLKLGDGFLENAEYFRLGFVNPNEVARGDAFSAILPVLWLMAGCWGEREDSKGSTPWYLPRRSPYAVLIREREFDNFRKAIAHRKDIKHMFLITDSEENFSLMRQALGRKYHCVQLYKNYLENFRINVSGSNS